jgi:hypothetical protein
MPNLPRTDLSNPAIQEKIRRGTHEYVPTAGKHGEYRPVGWTVSEAAPPVCVTANDPSRAEQYPKMMLKTPKPEWKQFKGRADAERLFDEEIHEWDNALAASVVNNPEEEKAWLANAEAREKEVLAQAKAAADAEREAKRERRDELLSGFREAAKAIKELQEEEPEEVPAKRKARSAA